MSMTRVGTHGVRTVESVEDLDQLPSEQERRDALTGWLHHYNQHRPHTACGNRPPFSRLTNVSGQYS